MLNRPWGMLTALIGGICGFALIRLLFFVHVRAISSDVVQGILVGVGLAFVTSYVLAKINATNINGWITMFGCGVPGTGMFMRAAFTHTFLGPVNVPQEAMYWTTSVDSVRRTLSGQHDYVMHFPAGGLPPNEAFWSLTMGNARNQFVANSMNRYSVSDRSGLVPNDDGSVDIYIQNTPPAERVSNWLPAPTGRFILWLRVYMPDATILDGLYKVPPVVEVR